MPRTCPVDDLGYSSIKLSYRGTGCACILIIAQSVFQLSLSESLIINVCGREP